MPADDSIARPPPNHWRLTGLVGAAVFCAYLLLLNPYWTPGGDSELFLAAARSIVRGQGYTYNGLPVLIAPPGWAYILAGVMGLSPSFLLIKFVALGLMTLSWVLAHRVLLRLGPPAWATWAVVLGALLVPVYSLTFWLHSEPLFCALAWGAMLTAVRVVEDRRRAGSLLGLILCCAGMASVRWTSGLQWGLVASVLLGGWGALGAFQSSATPAGPARSWPRIDGRITLGLGASAVATVLVFLLLFFLLPALARAEAVPVDLPVTVRDVEHARPPMHNDTIYRDLAPWQERLRRLGSAGHWASWPLWYPMRFARGLPALEWIPLAAGWGVIGLLGIAAWRALWARGRLGQWPRGRFVWPALVGYLFLLVLIWPLPNARYLVPVAPLLVMGVLWGAAGLGEMLRRPALGRAVGGVFLASVLGLNLGMYAIDVTIQRSGDRLFGGSVQRYYRNYEAGLHVSLLQAAEYLRQQDLQDRELAVSERYDNLGRMRFSKGGPRNVVMLLDRQVQGLLPVYSFVPSELPEVLIRHRRVLPGGFQQWAAEQDPPVRYYLYQQASQPWRLWHFRVPAGLQERLSGEPVEEESFGWLLFAADDGFTEPVRLPPHFSAPTRVGGL